ncbi:MAG TPA: GTPase HflX, partial [Methanocella sp.]|nr:GTPase HflX [Methanocella sp.]
MPRAVLIKRIIDPRKRNQNLEELEELARSAGYEVVDRITQVRPHPDKAYCIGKGKAKET